MSVRKKQYSGCSGGGGRRLRFIQTPTANEESLSSDTLSIYSNDSVKEHDGRFFEYFSSVHIAGLESSPSGDDVDGNRNLNHTKGRRPTLSQTLLETLQSMEKEEQKELSNKEKELLYMEFLYTIQHKIGAEASTKSAEAKLEELYTYGQKAFKVSDEQHNRLLSVTNRAKPPVLMLNVEVEEARNLEAKDADGFSDPYCMLGIIPGSRIAELERNTQDQETKDPSKAKSIFRKFSGSLRDRLKGSSKDNPTPVIPAKFIQSTKFITNTLNPEWHEKFKFDIEDVKLDKIHIDVWDHDDEESVFDAAKTLNKAKNLKGIGRVFKQIAQSARTSSGDNVDDFLGCIDIPLHDIPSTGYSDWYDLCGRSARSKVQGQIKVHLTLATREDHGIPIDDNFNDVQQHEDFLLIFIDHERRLFSGDDVDWPGLLSTEASLILHQHSIQGDITPLQEALCYWLAFSQKYREKRYDATCLWNILKTLEEKWNDGRLAGEEEARLAKSFELFLKYFLDMLVDIRVIFPADDSESIKHLESLVECVRFITESQAYAQCCPMMSDNLSTDIAHKLKHASKVFFNRVMTAICQDADEKTLKEKVEDLTSLASLLRSDVKQGLDVYNPVFYNILHIPYFDPTYKLLERKLASEIRKLLDEELSAHLLTSDVTPQSPPPTENQASKRRSSSQSTHSTISTHSTNSMKPPPAPTPQQDAKTLLISSVLNLYFCAQSFSQLQKHLIVGNKDSVVLSRYQDWFSRVVQEWLSLSKSKLDARIHLAVQYDKFVNIEDNFECSTSAVDVVNCYTQIADFWKRLKWKNEEELFAFSLKLADDICQSAVLYTDLLHVKMKKNSYFDDEGQFDVQQPLCTCLNDLEYIRRTLIELPERLQLPEVVTAIERRHHMNPESDSPSHFHTVFQTLIDTAVSTMGMKIQAIAQRVADRMRPDIKKNVFHLCWSPEKKPIQEAIEPLIDYLDNNLQTLYKYLLRRNFKILLSEIWQESLEEFQEVVTNTDEMTPALCTRIHQALEVLLDFFNADDKGLLKKDLHTDLYMYMNGYLMLQKMTTREIITAFYKDMIDMQLNKKRNGNSNILGTVGYKAHYDKAQEMLNVEINYCKDIIALDSNGLSDPYVVWDLCPQHVFKDCPEHKTTIKKKTLNPIYDETFQCQVPGELMKLEGTCIRFTLMDYNFVVKNDFGGEAYIATQQVPGVLNSIKGHQALRTAELVFMKPQNVKENAHLVALTWRTNDTAAQQFVTNRRALADEAQTNIEEYEAMNTSP